MNSKVLVYETIIRPTWGSTSIHLLSLVDAYFIRSELIVLRLLERHFLGLFGELDPPPVKFTLPLTWLASARFFVLQGAQSNTLDIWFLWLLSHIWLVNLWGRHAFRELSVLYVPNYHPPPPPSVRSTVLRNCLRGRINRPSRTTPSCRNLPLVRDTAPHT